MMYIARISCVLIFNILLLFISGCSGKKQDRISETNIPGLPYLKREGNVTHLMVDDKPFIMLGGELHNSSTAGFSYMQPLWEKMAEANLNTVIAAASWELVEPVEGEFDFRLVDSMILGARKEDLRLVIIWFASWKNGESTYVPAWVKKDQTRFPLVIDEKGNKRNILSTLGKESCSADAKAFAALMKHIREIDENDQTVIMVQVENEIGTLRTKRDYSEIANTEFNGPVPAILIDYLDKNKATIHPGVLKAWAKMGFKKEGKWEDVFGKGELLESWKDLSFLTEELFMAWNYASYVGKIAEAGKAEYNLPMYVNAWLKQPGPNGHAPGNYPSGGPSPQVIDIWRAAAPAIDFIAPDIYIVDEFRYVCEQYTQSGNPLFIPETFGDAAGASRAFYTFGRFNTLCYAPFGVDGGDSWANVNDLTHLKDAFSTLKQLVPFINEYTGTQNIWGLLVDKNCMTDSVAIGGYKIKGTLGKRYGGADLAGVDIYGKPVSAMENISQAGGAIIICTGPGEYFIAGRNMRISFAPENPIESKNVSFLLIEEGSFEDNTWIQGRRLNGDEFNVTLPSDRSKIFKAALYKY
jgi:hypothetical protein